jgi:hypothetical protein
MASSSHSLRATRTVQRRDPLTHMLDMRCRENKIAHRLTKIKHPWTDGRAERLNRTIKKATVKSDHYDRHGQRENHLALHQRR